ncbi:Maf family protein [Quadrisphaera setariae]|uniref:Nucleoside triphosphate pyrophosphatase n=1 Tax=Quadrisphaera setariae TaxID=2593304 RepID=A0A5C8ZMB6_9ACTN|nr:nucleoside triphosphate pyrophosphatase [Quadrisphaera setariae]TXR57940.1 septum formation inhibitor Maf [Quadrisphaera setariae]
MTAPVRLLLASASPARAATLRSAGVEPLVLVSGVDEPAVVERYGVTDPQDVALVLAKAKAEDVAARWEDAEGAPDGGVLVVGCDSVLELDGEAFGKPADAAQALERWKGMRGRSGVLHTGHWLVDAREDDGPVTGATLGAVASTTVHFADVSDAELEAYVATGEPLAVAGAFTLDGLGGAFVRGVEGDPHTVVGIGLPLLRELLAEVGVRWTDLWAPRA